MPRRGPAAWPPAPRRFRRDRQEGFTRETAKQARAQDRKRARSIKGNGSLVKGRSARLAKLLDSPTSHPRNMASMRYCRKRRRAINGHLGWLIARGKVPVTFVTLLPRDMLIPADELHEVVPGKFLEQIRAVLNRAGISSAAGWAYLVLDLEYIEHLDAYSFHVHGVATGAVAGVIRSLRERTKFKWQPDNTGLGKRPVQLKSVTPGEEARTVNYLIKTFHGKRVYKEEDGKRVRTHKKVAIPEPRHSEYLLWLSRWRIEDFVLPIHVFFGSDRLRVSAANVHSQKCRR
jgi:hypothetical protein